MQDFIFDINCNIGMRIICRVIFTNSSRKEIELLKN